jgi:NAD(P)-dependent dehydrogenase (short-subunit alcohol dehydrogenase family)
MESVYMGLRDKVIVITGGFGVLGVAVGVAAADQGALVALLDRTTAPRISGLHAPLAKALLIGETDLASHAGRIINIGAGAATRAGVAKLTESLAEELKDQGVTVNAVVPSIIDAPANRADMPSADFGRWVQPEALADVIVFLASDAARAITGALLPVSSRV